MKWGGTELCEQRNKAAPFLAQPLSRDAGIPASAVHMVPALHQVTERGGYFKNYRWRKVIRPRVRSYGESSTVTRSPGSTRM